MRTDRSDWSSAYAGWLSAVTLILVFELALIGSILLFPFVGELREVWAGAWEMWVAVAAVALVYTLALIPGSARFERAALAMASVLLVIFGIALASFRTGPLDDRWYAAASAHEDVLYFFEGFALIEFESSSDGPCDDAPGRCAVLLLDDGRRMWMPIPTSIDPYARIVIVERLTGEVSGRSRLVVRHALFTEDWQLKWTLHLREVARRVDERVPLEY